jgi:hypothetical protein
MAEIPVITIAGPQPKEPKQFFTRVFCLRKEPPPISLLIEYLKARGASPIIPSEVNEKLLNSWNWVGIEIGYAREKKPILLTCVRKGGAQDDIFKQDVEGLLHYVESFREIDNWRVVDQLRGCRFYVANILDKNDITEEGYDFNGWILQFFQENCDGMVQIDGQGFFDENGEILFELPPLDDEPQPDAPPLLNPEKPSQPAT